MNEVVRPKRRWFQFGVRRLLSWTAVVALGFGILSYVEPPLVRWIVVPGWCAVVLILRWGIGGVWAAMVSVMIGVLLCGLVGCMLWAATHGTQEPGVLAAISILAGLFGSQIGFVPFLLVEAACRTVNWIDRIGQSDG